MTFISSFNPAAFCGVNKRLRYNIYLEEENQKLLAKNFAGVQQIWPRLGEGLPGARKAELLFAKLTERLYPRKPSQITGEVHCSGSAQAAYLLTYAYLLQEQNKALLALYSQLPGAPRLEGTMEKSAAEARNWMGANLHVLSRVKELNLSGKGLSCIPKEIVHFPNLTYLDLNHNNITFLPEDLRWPPRLSSLLLGHNEIQAIPKKMVWPPGLIKLNLGYNKLRSLPEAMQWPSKVTHININYNELESLPERMQWPASLEQLRLDGNKLKTLPVKMEGATGLSLLFASSNQIASLPEKIEWPPLLAQLHLDGNKLTLLDEAMTWPPKLKELDLSREQARCNSKKCVAARQAGQIPPLLTR